MAIGVPVGFILIALYGVVRHERVTNGGDWDLNYETLVTSPFKFISPSMILGFRIFVFFFAFGLQIAQIATLADRFDGARAYTLWAAYTIWNFSLLIIYFGLGSYLSFIYVTGRAVPHDRLFLHERMFWVVQEVEFPNTILVFLVVWMVLYPGTLAVGNPEAVVNFFSFFQHGINMLVMFLDFWFTG